MHATYIHERPDWPHFTFDAESLISPLANAVYRSGSVSGRLSSLGLADRLEAELDATVSEIGDSSDIEGEHLNRSQVRSSVAQRLGIDTTGLPVPERHVDGVVEMSLDAKERYQQPLTAERLFGWHAALFPTGWSGFHRIQVGEWRDDRLGPMQVVSGPIGKERVHFEAPHASRVPGEMDRFIEWFEGDDRTEGHLKAALAHLWFVTIHPFDDGNGRIARAILDMALARAEGSARRGYSLSAGILQQREEYYTILERTQKGTLDVTPYLSWYVELFESVVSTAANRLEHSLWRSRFWSSHADTPLNERQRRVLYRLLGDFYGKLSNEKWTKLTGASHDTALRDLNDLVAKGILIREGEGRGARYRLAEGDLAREVEREFEREA